MMGGMLEGLLLARLQQLRDRGLAFKTKACPKDNAGKPLGFDKWCLNNYMDVTHELKLISQTGKDISAVLRDYRNFIHPKEEYKGTSISPGDAQIMWEIAKGVTGQLLK